MKQTINVFDYCETFLAGRSLISVEWIDDNDQIFEGTVQELEDTLDADLRAICSVAKVRAAIPQLCLRTGTPLSTCIMI